jgi:bifunctional DNA-binding transcriptional regulator/antitoxin component of YhaV-PrlF toxin-antitoxin module
MSAKYQETRKIRATSRVFQKGKTQVPSETRSSLGIKDGDNLVWIVENGKWIIERA